MRERGGARPAELTGLPGAPDVTRATRESRLPAKLAG
jgi:hypothetical protein